MGMLEDRTYINEDVLERLRYILGLLLQEKGDIDPEIKSVVQEIKNIDPDFYFRCKERFENCQHCKHTSNKDSLL